MGTCCLMAICLVGLSGCALLPSLFSALISPRSSDQYARDAIGAYREPIGPKVVLKSVALTTSTDANADSAVTVHLVFVNDPKVVDIFMSLSASQYFSQVQDFNNRFPGTFSTNAWQLTPGQSVVKQTLDTGSNPVAAIIFADYTTPGNHRKRIGDATHVRVSLERDQFQIFNDAPRR